MASRKYPELRTGDAYTSDQKDEFDHTVSVTYNYGQLKVGIDQANALAAYYFKEVKKDFAAALENANVKGVLKPSMKNPGTYSSAVLFPSGYTKKIDADIRGMATETAAFMREEIKKVIRTAPGAKGPGRIDTHRMIDSVFGRRTKYEKGKGVITVSAGWLDLWYKYFGFQEEGTDQIKPMRSILHTAMVTFPAVFKKTRMYTGNFGKRVGFRGYR